MSYAPGGPSGHEAPTPAYDPSELLERLEGHDFGPDRQAIIQGLLETPWFQRTDIELQTELLTLPENHDGFLEDLYDRPEEIGGIVVDKLVDLPRGNFALTPKFAVTNEAGQGYTYEYVSWRQGPHSGAKGIIFTRPDADSAPTGFIVLQGEKFATGQTEFDAIGGFMDLGEDGVGSVDDRILVEIAEELGVDPDDMAVDEVIDLGRVRTDAGMTNNSPSVFAAFITNETAAALPHDPSNQDSLELRSKVVARPIEELPAFVEQHGDGLLNTAIARSAVRGLVSLSPNQ